MLPEKCRVLIIKGNKGVRDYTKEILEKIGFKSENIHALDKANKALEFLKSTPVDLVLSEAGISAPELLVNLKKAGMRDNIIFILYTGGGEAYARFISEQYGADGFISLPTTIGEFDKKIKQALKINRSL